MRDGIENRGRNEKGGGRGGGGVTLLTTTIGLGPIYRTS